MSSVNLLSDETINVSSPQNMSDEYKNLRKHYNSLKDVVDKCKQELYDITRNNNVSKKIISDMEMENENLEKENSGLKETIKTLKNEINNINKKQADNQADDQACNESMLFEKDKEIIKLQNEIESMNSIKIMIETKLEEEVGRLTVDNLRLSNENETLTEYVLEMKKEHSEVVVQYEQTIDNLKEQICQLQNDVKYKQEELIAAKGLRKIMTEEIAMQRSEMEIMKNTSSKQIVKGNSLFAEVDDRRLQLQNEIRNIKQKYIDIKQKLTMKNTQIQKIQMEYECLLNKFREQPKEQFEEIKLQEEAYQTKIKDLTEIVNYLKDELSRSKIEVDIKSDKIPVNVGDFIYNVANASRNEFKALTEKIVSQSTDLFILKESLIEAKKEISKWMFEALQSKAKVTVQQVELEEIRTRLSTQQKETLNSKQSSSITKISRNKLQDISNEKNKIYKTTERSLRLSFTENNPIINQLASKPVRQENIEQKCTNYNLGNEMNNTSDFKTENISNEMYDNLSIIDNSKFNLQNENNLLDNYSNIFKNVGYNSSKLSESSLISENQSTTDEFMEDSCKKNDYDFKENKQSVSIILKDNTSKVKKLCFSEDTQEPRQTDHAKFKHKGGVIIPIKHRVFIPSKKSTKTDEIPPKNN